jgi:conjugal transfer pilus assembly protein TraK
LRYLTGAVILVFFVSLPAWAGCPSGSCGEVAAPESAYSITRPENGSVDIVPPIQIPQASAPQKHLSQPVTGQAGDLHNAKDASPAPDLNFFKERQTVEKLTQYLQSQPEFIVVVPERPTPVKLSTTDMNRITCMDGPIRDINYSGEKGVLVKINGKEAYVKYKALKSPGKTQYATNPTELIVNCNDRIYTLITVPERIPTQTVRLIAVGGESAKANKAFFTGMSVEQKILAMVKAVYTGEIPESFTVVTEKDMDLNVFRDVELIGSRTVIAEGEGLKVKELQARLRKNVPLTQVDLDERDFLNGRLGANIIGISLEKPHINAGESIRVFICEGSRES